MVTLIVSVAALASGKWAVTTYCALLASNTLIVGPLSDPGIQVNVHTLSFQLVVAVSSSGAGPPHMVVSFPALTVPVKAGNVYINASAVTGGQPKAVSVKVTYTGVSTPATDVLNLVACIPELSIFAAGLQE